MVAVESFEDVGSFDEAVQKFGTRQVFQLYDVKTRVFLFYTPAVTKGDYLRGLEQMVLNCPDTMVARYPEHYMVYFVGTYYEGTGDLDFLSTKQNLGFVSDFVSVKKQNVD